MTIGQAAYVLWYLLSKKPGTETAVFLSLMSAGVFALQVFYQLSVRLQAKQTLKRYRNSGKLPEDFWKTQNLRLGDDILSLKCGRKKLEYDCAYFVKAEVVGRMLVLTFQRGKQIHQLQVPERVFGTPEEEGRFLNAVRDSGQESLRAGLQEKGEVGGDGVKYAVRYSIDQEDYQKAFVRCVRRLYLTSAGLTLKNLARLAGAAFLIGNAIAGTMDSPAFIVFTSLISFILLVPFLTAFTPLESVFARQSADTLYGGLDTLNAALLVFGDRLAWQSERFFNEIPIERLIATEKDSKYAYLYLNDGTSVFVRITEENKTELTRCWLFLDSLAEKNRRNRFPKK